MKLIRLSREYIKEFTQGNKGNRPKLDSCSLCLGSFDGLHLGHAGLISRVKQACEQKNLASSAVFTFLQHPRLLLEEDPGPFLLTTWREKLSVLEDLGCDVIVAADFCPELSILSYRQFTESFLMGYLGMRHLVAGYDVHLGADRQGTAETLGALGQEIGFTMEVMPAVRVDDRIVSSTAIRQALTDGDMALSTAMLGRPYALWGEVIPGDSRGREIGYPTANILPLESLKLLPECGVYAVRIQIPGDVVPPENGGVIERVTETLPEVDQQGKLLSTAPGKWAVCGGMLNFGRVPTFHGDGLPEARIEVHIFGFSGDLRGRNVKIEWIERLRGERRFAGVAELVEQLGRDETGARKILGLSN